MADSSISDLVRADHEKSNEKFNGLEQIAETFDRGDSVYCARVENNQVSIRYGIINRIFYQNQELMFSIAPTEQKNADFTISTKKWSIFANETDLYDFLTVVFNGEDTETEIPSENPQG